MKNKVLTFVLAMFLVLPCAFMLSACVGGEATVNGFRVNFNGQTISSSNNTVELDYDPYLEASTWRSNITVYKTFDNGTESNLQESEYSVAGLPETINANEEGYNITISYGEYPSLTIKVVVNKAEVDRPQKMYSDEMFYNTILQTGVDMSNFSNASQKFTTSGATEAINAGDYSATFTLNQNYKWSTPDVNGSYTANHVVNWKINKLPIEVPQFLNSDFYDGSPKTPYVPVGSNYELKLPNQTYTEANEYDVAIVLKDPDNYCWNDAEKTTGEKLVSYQISSSSNTVLSAYQNFAVTYKSNLNGTQETPNPLNVAFNSYYGNDEDVYVAFENNGEITAYYKRKSGIWKLFNASNSSINTINSGNYYVKLVIPETASYSESYSYFYLTIDPIIIPASAIPTLQSQSYTGEVLTPNVSETEYFTVDHSNNQYIVASDYYTVILRAKTNYAFFEQNSYTYVTYLNYKITQAENSITNLSLTSWEYDGTPTTPTATIAYGESNVSYEWSNAENGTYQTYNPNGLSAGYNYPTAIGTYYLKASVQENQNWKSAQSSVVSFSITTIDVENKTKAVLLSNDASTPIDYFWLSTSATGTIPSASLISLAVGGEDVSSEYYDVTASNNTAVGEATLTLTMKGVYSGIVTRTFNIINSVEDLTTGSDIYLYIAFTDGASITSTLNIQQNMELVFPFDVTVTATTSSHLFNISNQANVNVYGNGRINSTITGDFATFYVQSNNCNLTVKDNLRLNTLRNAEDTTSLIKNFETTGGNITIKKVYTKNGNNLVATDGGLYYSACINLVANGGDFDIEGGMFTSSKVGIYIKHSSSTVNIGMSNATENDGYVRFSLAESVSINETELVGAEIIAGTLNVFGNGRIIYNVGETRTAEAVLVLDNPGKVKGTIVVGKPSSTCAGNINLNIYDGAQVANSGPDQLNRLIIWDITNSYGNYTFTPNIGDGSQLSVKESLYKKNIKQGSTIHGSEDFTIYQMSECDYMVDESITYKDATQGLNFDLSKLIFGEKVISMSNSSNYYSTEYGAIVANSETKLSMQILTLTGKGSIVGTKQITLYYLDTSSSQNAITGFNNLPNNALVTSTTGITFEQTITIAGKNITFIIPQNFVHTFRTSSSATNLSTEEEKSAIVIKANGETNASLRIVGGGKLVGRQAHDYNAENAVLTSANLFYVANGSKLDLTNITLQSGNDLAFTSVVNLIYADGIAKIYEGCTLSSNTTCAVTTSSGVIYLLKANNNVGVTATSTGSVNLIENAGTVDYSNAGSGLTYFTVPEGKLAINGGTIIAK